MSNPNMAAIAREAGVGKATVSLALRNDPRLRPETRRHIQEIAHRMGYRANAVVSNLMAQLRASRNPKYQATLGILNASSQRNRLKTNNTFRSWIDGIGMRCLELGYGIDEFWLHEPGLGPERLLQILKARNIRGVIIAGIEENREIPATFDVLWQDLASVVVGVRPERPTMHFACNDQYSTAMHAAWELERLGYKRPGMVVDPMIDANIDHRFTAGFHAGRSRLDPASDIPMFAFAVNKRPAFESWLSTYRPDVLVCTHPEVRDWISALGLSCPEDIGLIHLDLAPTLAGWSGMDQNNDHVGAFAVDLVVGQIHRNESGIPIRPKCMMTESQWVQGETLRSSCPIEAAPKRSRRQKTPARV